MRILIVRLSAIGDILFATPLIAALKRAWPESHLAWLVQPEYRSLLEGHPDLDEVIPCPLGEWRQLWRAGGFGELYAGIRTLRAQLRAREFDLALDLQGLLKSGALAWLSGAPERIGLGAREGTPWLMTRVIPRGGDARRIGSEYLYLAETLKLPVGDFAMRIQYGTRDLARAERLLGLDARTSDAPRQPPPATVGGLDARTSGAPKPPATETDPGNAHGSPPDGAPSRTAPTDTRPAPVGGRSSGFAVLCPFTTRPQKHWFEERWAELAARIRKELGLLPVLLGGPADRAAAARIVAASHPPPLDLTGQTRLTEAAALIDRAALLVAVDTGLGHLGIACGTPCLLLFGSTRPYLDTTRDNAQVLYHPLPCSPCRRRPTCDGRFDCMRRIEPDAVLAAARTVMAAPRALHAPLVAPAATANGAAAKLDGTA